MLNTEKAARLGRLYCIKIIAAGAFLLSVISRSSLGHRSVVEYVFRVGVVHTWLSVFTVVV